MLEISQEFAREDDLKYDSWWYGVEDIESSSSRIESAAQTCVGVFLRT